MTSPPPLHRFVLTVAPCLCADSGSCFVQRLLASTLPCCKSEGRNDSRSMIQSHRFVFAVIQCRRSTMHTTHTHWNTHSLMQYTHTHVKPHILTCITPCTLFAQRLPITTTGHVFGPRRAAAPRGETAAPTTVCIGGWPACRARETVRVSKSTVLSYTQLKIFI